MRESIVSDVGDHKYFTIISYNIKLLEYMFTLIKSIYWYIQFTYRYQ